MTGCVRVKASVSFDTIAPGGFRILGAIEAVARSLAIDIVITSACDGLHSGPNDPHHLGNAYDLRSKTFGQAMKDDILWLLLLDLCEHSETLQPVSIGYATTLFYAQIENRGEDGEHIHVQVRNAKAYPPVLKTEALTKV